MADLTDAQEISLRKYDHSSLMYLAVLVPNNAITATVKNNEARGATVIEYENVLGTEADVKAGHLAWFGSASGGSDVGKARIKSIDAGNNELTIEENDLDLAVGNHISVKRIFLPRIKLPSIDNSGASVVFKKDGEVYTDQNEHIPPVVVMGPPAAALIDPGTNVATVKFVDVYSWFPSGASLTSAVWDYNGGSVTGGAGTAADPYVVTYGVAGTYWVSLTVTDDEGKSKVGWRPVYIYDADNLPYTDFAAGPRENSLQGTRQSFEVFGDAAQTDFPDDTWVIRFNRDWYGGSEEVLETRYPWRGNIKYVGFLKAGSLRVADDMSSVSFETTDIAGVLDALPGFGDVLVDRASPTIWTEMKDLGAIKAVYHVLERHTTALDICDLRYSLALSASEILIREQRWGKDSILSQCNLLLSQRGVFANLAATVQGCLEIRQDPTLMKTADRAGTVVKVSDLSQADFYSLDIARQPGVKTQMVRAGGFSYDGATAAPLMAKSPGVPAGAMAEPRYDGLILSPTDGQTGLNRIVGDLQAKLDNALARVVLHLVGNYDVFDAVLQERVTFPLAAIDNVRGLVFTSSDNWLVREVSIDENAAGGFVRGVDITLERETDGDDGLTITIPSPDSPDWPEPPLPPAPPPEPSPIEPPEAVFKDYVIATDEGVFRVDLTETGAQWVPVNGGLASSDALYAYAIHRDPLKYVSDGRMWLGTRDGIYRMDDWPAGVWEQVISMSDIETASGLTYSSGDYILHVMLDFSAEVEDRFCICCNMTEWGVANTHRCSAMVVDAGTITNYYAIESIAQVNLALRGRPAVKFVQDSGGEVIYASSNMRRDITATPVRLIKTVNGGTNWTAVATNSTRTGFGSILSIPFLDSEQYILWGVGGIGGANSGGVYLSSDYGVSFPEFTALRIGEGFVWGGTNNSHLRIWLLAGQADAVESRWTKTGDLPFITLPLYANEIYPKMSLTTWTGDDLAEVLIGGDEATHVWLVLLWSRDSPSAWQDKTLNLGSFGVEEVWGICKA